MRFLSRARLPLRRRAILLGLPAIGLAMIVSGASSAADPFVAGGPSSRPLAIDAVAKARAASRAEAVGRALGLAVGSQSVRRVDDRFDHQVYDEVTTTDDHGRPVAIYHLDAGGGVLMAVGLGWKAAGGGSVDEATAATRASHAVRTVGIDVADNPQVSASRAAGGWSVVWPRIVDGVPAPGDGVRVSVWADGSFHALTRSERALAPRPSDPVSAEQAVAAAERVLQRLLPKSRDHLALATPSLAWIAPNDTFDASRPDAPAAVLRLAWVVEGRATGPLAERLNAVQVWIDAGDGSVLGGDIAE